MDFEHRCNLKTTHEYFSVSNFQSTWDLFIAIPETMTAINPTFGKDVFLEWRSPRRGISNPQRMDNPVWEWLIQTGESSYSLNDHFDGPSSYGGEPQWSFDRFGQSSTKLSDGREVRIAG